MVTFPRRLLAWIPLFISEARRFGSTTLQRHREAGFRHCVRFNWWLLSKCDDLAWDGEPEHWSTISKCVCFLALLLLWKPICQCSRLSLTLRQAVLSGVRGPATLIFLGFSGKLQARTKPHLDVSPQRWNWPGKIELYSKIELFHMIQQYWLDLISRFI